MFCKRVIVFTFAALSLSLFSMEGEMEEIKLQEDNPESNIHVIEPSLSPKNFSMKEDSSLQPTSKNRKKCWPYKMCPKPYGDRDCNKCRAWTSGIAGGISGVITGIQLFSCCLTWLMGDGTTCKDVALCVFTGNEKGLYPTNYPYTYCDSRASICWAALSIGLTAINGAGIITSACAWNPCCNEKGCILCVKDEDSNSLKTDSIELQGN